MNVRKVLDWFDISDCWVNWCDVGQGVVGFFCFTSKYQPPIGTAYAAVGGPNAQGETHAEILDTYVNPEFRRRGVRKLLNDKIAEYCNATVIYTTDGTTDGAAFMNANGYEYNADVGVWAKRVRPADVSNPPENRSIGEEDVSEEEPVQ